MSILLEEFLECWKCHGSGTVTVNLVGAFVTERCRVCSVNGSGRTEGEDGNE